MDTFSAISGNDSESSDEELPLSGVRILDASNLIAGPMVGMLLGDYGADIIKLEHPTDGDPLRNHGTPKDGEPLWWKYIGRNKKVITLYLGDPEAQDLFKQLAASVDVVIESYRPGTMDKWGLGYEELSRDNPGLVMAHISGYGQMGPRSALPGFGTIGEAMSGFVFRNGYPDGSPTLPPFGLADVVTGMMGAFAVMVALRSRDRDGKGQEVDLSIVESLLPILEPQILEYDQLGTLLTRLGNRNPMNSPRGIYRTSDDAWLAVSGSTTPTAARMMTLIGRGDMVDMPWFGSANQRAQHAAEFDDALSAWAASQTMESALAACSEAGVPATKVYSAADILADEQYEALGTIATVEDDVLGPVRMPNVTFRLSRTPGRIRWIGPERGAHNAEVYGGLGVSEERQADLKARGVI
jgi:crotonobetainyl-CoA:carnitine CoA-transferase CaiB-like acyl-CoA transferase